MMKPSKSRWTDGLLPPVGISRPAFSGPADPSGSGRLAFQLIEGGEFAPSPPVHFEAALTSTVAPLALRMIPVTPMRPKSATWALIA
jgi:hypothetical protein